MFRPIITPCILLVASACSTGPQPRPTLPAPDVGVEVPDPQATDSEPRLANGDEILDLLVSRYPPQLRERGISGSVTFFVFVDPSGRVTQIRLRNSSKEPEFDRAAEAIARSMEFWPTLLDREPIGVWIMQKIDFDTR